MLDPKHDPPTPVELCRHIISLVEWEDGERVLEPANGTGVFYNNLPPNVTKDWCEILDGRDFFQWTTPCDTIITNPPFRVDDPTAKYGRKNIVIPFLERSLELAQKRVMFLINHKSVSGLTPARLQKWHDKGWSVTKMCVFAIKAWFGRYYLVVFEKDKPAILEWSRVNW